MLRRSETADWEIKWSGKFSGPFFVYWFECCGIFASFAATMARWLSFRCLRFRFREMTKESGSAG
jgi:hypothetical protein